MQNTEWFARPRNDIGSTKGWTIYRNNKDIGIIYLTPSGTWSFLIYGSPQFEHEINSVKYHMFFGCAKIQQVLPIFKRLYLDFEERVNP